jgi:hypothetical protein
LFAQFAGSQRLPIILVYGFVSDIVRDLSMIHAKIRFSLKNLILRDLLPLDTGNVMTVLKTLLSVSVAKRKELYLFSPKRVSPRRRALVIFKIMKMSHVVPKMEISLMMIKIKRKTTRKKKIIKEMICKMIIKKKGSNLSRQTK